MSTALLANKIVLYPFSFDTPHDIVRAVCIWLTLAMIIAFLVVFFVSKKEKRPLIAKRSLIIAILYAAAVGITFLIFGFVENKQDDAFVKDLFYPLLAAILVIAASAVLLYFKNDKTTRLISGIASGAAVIVVLVFMGIRFANGKGAEMNWLTNDDVKSIALYVASVLAFGAVLAAAFLSDRGSESGFNTKSISYAAICIALSFALSYLRIIKMPQGGSITIASLLPLMIYSYMFGCKKGVFAGAIYGLLQAIQDPYIIHPAQFLLDYPLAFACIGLAGIFANVGTLSDRWKFALGGVVAGLCRFVMHYLSGVFAFGAFAPEGQSPFLYSLIYQAGYVLPDIAIAIVVGVLVFSSKTFVKTVLNASSERKG